MNDLIHQNQHKLFLKKLKMKYAIFLIFNYAGKHPRETLSVIKKPLYIFLFIVIVVFSSFACSGGKNNSNVSIQEGLISLYQNDTVSNFYNILEVNYQVSGDTTSLQITAVNRDSSDEYLVIGFRDIINFGEKKYNITGIKEELETNIVYVYLQKKLSNGYETIPIENGTIDVVKYSPNSVLQAKLEFKQILNNDSITQIGELNLDFSTFDSNRIPNLPIPPGTMNIETDTAKFQMTCVASYVVSLNKYVINGISQNNENLVITLENFKPKINYEYQIGQSIDSIGKVFATFDDGTDLYTADGKNGTSGKITIKKLTYNSIQGYFECVAYNSKKKIQVELKNGLFYAKLKVSE